LTDGDDGLSADDYWQGVLARYEQDLGIPKGVIWSLRDEPDVWTFFIKAHALIESALTTVLRAQDKRLADILEALPLSHTKYGRIAAAQALGVLDKEDAAFFQVVQRMRNLLVHDIRNVAFDFKKYFASLSAEHRRQITDVLTYGFRHHYTTPEVMEDNISRHPGFTTWNGLVKFIITLTGRLPGQTWPKQVTVEWEEVRFEDAAQGGESQPTP